MVADIIEPLLEIDFFHITVYSSTVGISLSSTLQLTLDSVLCLLSFLSNSFPYLSFLSVVDELLHGFSNLASPLNPLCSSNSSSLVFYRLETGDSPTVFARVRCLAEDYLAIDKHEFCTLFKNRYNPSL